VLNHTNGYTYSCDWCGKGFSWQSALEKHKRVHTGERPYLCKVCDKSFTQKNALKYHHRVHTGERIKREATDTQQEQEKSAMAITFPKIKAEEEVSCISLYPLLFGFSNILGCQNNFVLCYTHDCTQYVHLNMFQTNARDTETFHVLSFIATELFPYHMFGLPFTLNCFQSTSYVCILCAFP